ncbi:hypothetical protein BH20BAC1_BH20BAC1_16450 [soil metagenome]
MNNWYLIHTKNGCEERIHKNLAGKKIQSYLPNNQRLNSDNDKRVSTPLFPNLVFVKTTPDKFNKIRRIRGVLHFLYWISSPVCIQNEDLEILKEFVESHKEIALEKCMVNVDRPFEALNFPIITRANDIVTIQNTITKLYLPSLGYILTVIHEHQPLEFGKRQSMERTFSAS